MSPVALIREPRHAGRRRRAAVVAPPSRERALDVVIVGGGPAGLSAALVLGRARKRVLVPDTGQPANARVEAIGGLIGQQGVGPAELRRSARAQLDEHPDVTFRGAAAVAVEQRNGRFAVELEDGTTVEARGLLLAHGLRYDPPQLPGIERLWARSVFHCPFCDGWEVRDRALAVHGSGPAAAQSALFVSNWSDDVLLCTDGPAQLDATERDALAAAGVRVREEPIRRLRGEGERLTAIEFMTGPAERRDALFVRTRREQPNGLAESLGVALGENGTIVTDGDGRTNVPGIYAAGDAATDHSRSVANAIGTGSRVAYALTTELARASRAAVA